MEKARAFEAAELLGTQFLQIDAAAPDALAGEMFDGVVCNYGLSDIDDVRASSKYLSGLPDGAARDDGGPSRLCDPKVGTPPPHREAFSAS